MRRCLIIFALSIAAMAQTNDGQPRIVQDFSMATSTSGGVPANTIRIGNVTAGDVLFGCTSYRDATNAGLSVTDDHGDTYTIGSVSHQDQGGADSANVHPFWATASASGTYNVTLSGTVTNNTFWHTHVAEIANVTASLDGTQQNAGANVVVTSLSTSHTTTTNGSFIIACSGNINGASGDDEFMVPNTGFYVGGETGNGNGILMWARNTGALGTYSMSNNMFGGGAMFVMSSVAFKPTTIAITTTALPDCVGNSPCDMTIAGVGGTAALSFSLASGSLPTGLTMASNGHITGTPTGPSTTFSVQVTDGTLTSSPVSFTLNVRNSFSTPTFVQFNHTGISSTISLSTNVTSGNAILIIPFGPDQHGTTGWTTKDSYWSDTLGTVFHRMYPSSGTQVMSAPVYCGIAPSSGSDSVTWADPIFPTAANLLGIVVEEWSGIQCIADTGSSVALFPGTLSAGATYPVSTSATTVMANTLIHAVTKTEDAGGTPDSHSPSSPFASVTANTNFPFVAQKLEATAGTYSYTDTVTTGTICSTGGPECGSSVLLTPFRASASGTFNPTATVVRHKAQIY